MKKKILFFYGLIWTLVFLSPYLRNMHDLNEMNWNRMIGDSINLALFFIVFLVNLLFLIPKLLFTNKRTKYIIAVSFIVLLVAVLDILLHKLSTPPRSIAVGFHPSQNMYENPFVQFSFIGTMFNNLIIAILVIGSSTALEVSNRWLIEEKKRKDIEKEHLKTNLALLRHQVSPHFLMNTLNNIHSLIEMDSEKAQDAVERLSILMRYLLYDSAQTTIELKKEIDFIKSFVNLMQLRYSDNVKVTIVIPHNIPEVKIPPMLFISLLENAFKHGVSYPDDSFIYFEIEFQNKYLICNIKNSKPKVVANSQGEYSGIGIENIKESLRLLYEDNFQFNFFNKENDFEVNLKIPL